MSGRLSKADAVERVIEAAVDFGSAADGVTDGAARALGVNRTDMRVLSLLRSRGALPVGRIAQLVGLSPAAATVVVRRLTESGYAAQAADPSDGRRTVVSLTATARDRLVELYGSMLDQGRSWLARLTVQELTTVAAVLREAENLQLDLAGKLDAGMLRRR